MSRIHRAAAPPRCLGHACPESSTEPSVACTGTPGKRSAMDQLPRRLPRTSTCFQEKNERPVAKVLGLTTWGAHPCEEQSQAPQDQRRAYQKRISVLGWNSGGARRLPTAIPTMITGPWHAILLQECHGILDELRRGELFHVVETGGASDMAIAVRKSTFTHVQPYHYHYNTPSAHSWGCVLTVAKCTLAAPWPSNNSPDDGHRHITVGTMHLHSISAKKQGVAPELLRRVDEAMETHHVDILHGDFNMASSLGYVSAVFDDLVYIQPNDQDILWGMPKQIGDCCGFVLRRTHWMVDAFVTKHGTWDFNYPEVLGIGPADTNSSTSRRPPTTAQAYGASRVSGTAPSVPRTILAQAGAQTGCTRRGQGVGHHVYQGQEHAIAQYQHSWEQRLLGTRLPGNSILT